MDGILKKNLIRIENEIGKNFQESLNPEELAKIVAVSKRQSEQKIRELYKLGVRHFAENYWQEAKEKISNLEDLDITWHFIGSLQSKKIKDIVGSFDYIQSLDKMEVAEKVAQKAEELGIVQKVFVQINIAQEMSKQGVSSNQALIFLHQLKKLKPIQVCGLMVFPPLCRTEDESRHWFREGFEIFRVARGHMGEAFKHLSMGTSSDYVIALQEGSNMLRLGEILMGPRI